MPRYITVMHTAGGAIPQVTVAVPSAISRQIMVVGFLPIYINETDSSRQEMLQTVYINEQ